MFCPNSRAVVSSQGLFGNLGTSAAYAFWKHGNNCSLSRLQPLYRMNSKLIVQQSLDGRRGVTGTSNKTRHMICLINS